MTDAFDPAFFALGSDTTLTEEQARQITSEATAVAQRSQTFAHAVGNEQRLATRQTKDLAHNRRAMYQYRCDAALVSENAAMRSDFRASLEDKMRSAVGAVVSPRPPSPTSVDGLGGGIGIGIGIGIGGGGGHGEENNANMDVDGRGNGGGDDEDDDLMTISTATGGGGGGIGIGVVGSGNTTARNYPDPLKYIAKRRQELAKRRAAIQSGTGQINATLRRARTANAKDGALKEKMAADHIAKRKVEQDREVEARRRELEGTKRREASLAESSRATHARYLENGTAIAEKNAEHMALKRKNLEMETELSENLNTIEEEMTKTISTEISTIEARIATLSGQLDHLHRQHGEVQQLRAEVVASIDAATQLLSEKDQAQKVNETVTAELLSVETKVKAAEAKLSEVVKAEEEANMTQGTIDKEEQDKLAAVEAEKAQLLQKREMLTGLLVRMQQGGSTQDVAESGKTEADLAAKDAERKTIADNMAEKTDALQTIDASIAARRAQAVKDEQYDEGQIVNLQRTRSVTVENVVSLRDAIDAKKETKSGSKGKAIDTIRKAFDEKRASFDFLLSTVRSGKTLLIDSRERSEECEDRPVKIEQEDVEGNLSPQDVVLSTEAAPSPSQSQRNTGRSRSARRRRNGGGVGGSRRRTA